MVTRSDSSVSSSVCGSRCIPGNTCAAPASAHVYGSPQAFAWNIGTTGITTSASPTAEHAGGHGGERVEDDRAVRVEHALRAGGRAARVAHRGGLTLAELRQRRVRVAG